MDVDFAVTQQAIPDSKLRPPRLPDDHVLRPRLFERLNSGLERRLTLAAAPPGFGKTTLLAAWAASNARRAAWLTLDETDDGLGPFVRSLVAAVARVAPGCGRTTLRLLALPELPGAAYLAQALAGELAELHGELVLVLDDYHAVQHPAIRELVEGLLRYLPLEVHPVLGTRDDPTLPLARLRARDELTELRAEELRFTELETETFLIGALGPESDGELAAELTRRTDGWAAALRLATVALRKQPDRQAWVRRFGGDELSLRTFLIDEILAGQDRPTRDFLLETAILERVCRPLRDALAERPAPPADSQAVLDHIARAHLLTPLDPAGTWYQYHPLFREALLHELRSARGEAELQALHRRATGWFAEQGMLKEALQHALKGGDPESAAQLVEACAHELLDREEWPLLDACLRALPPELVSRRPALLLARCWVAQVRMASAALPPLLDRVEQLLSDSAATDATPRLQAEVDALRALVDAIRGDLRLAVERGWRALRDLPATFHLGRRNAASAWSVASQLLGQREGEEALAWLRSESARTLHDPDGHSLQLAMVAGLVHLVRGEYQALEQVLAPLTAQAGRAGYSLSAGWGHYMLGWAHYLRDELPEARERFGAVLANQQCANGLVLRETLLGLALCQQAQGSPDAARGALGVAEDLAAETVGFDPQHAIVATKWRLALLRGERVDVPRGTPPGRGESTLTLTSLSVECPTLTRAWALLAAGDRAALAEATELSDWLVARLESLRDPARLAAALALRALIHHAQSEVSLAHDDLRRAVELAQPCGLVRPFLDLGAPLAGLLAELIGTLPPDERAYPSRLLAAFPPAAGPREPVLPSRHLAESESIERLTWREAEVLEQVAQHLTNKEIADILFVSPETVKKHVANICQKLQVANRREAVIRARVLGLLTTQITSAN